LSDFDKRKGCPNQKLNAERCPCEIDCARRGICCECIEFHRKLGEVPACIAGGNAPAEAPKKASEAVPPRGDDFRLTDFASCAG